MPSTEKTLEPQAFTDDRKEKPRWWRSLGAQDQGQILLPQKHREFLFKCLNTSGISDEGTEGACKIQLQLPFLNEILKPVLGSPYISFKQKSDEMLLDIRERRQCFDYFHNGLWNKI